MTTSLVPPSSTGAAKPPALQITAEKKIGEFELTVDFALNSGLGVLFGPSGAGKSLTLALIAGLVRPTTGCIAINGRPVADTQRRLHVSTQERRVGMVFQDGLLLPNRTVVDNVALAVRDPLDRRERREAARTWLAAVGAADLADRSPVNLSGGQRQRVALARGLAGCPEILLLDEPLSALDLATRRELRSLIRAIVTETGVPSLLVTHDQAEAEELADVIIPCEEGRITGDHARRISRESPPVVST